MGGRNIRQPDHILGNPLMSHEAERRAGAGEEWLAATHHNGAEIEPILVNETKIGQASRQDRAGNFDLPVALGFQLADRALKIALN